MGYMSDKDEPVPFYLGERPAQPEKEEEKKEEKECLKISYGGAMPELLEHYRPEQRTNADLEKARILSEKYTRKNMVHRRLLYLERKQQELTGYMMDAGKRKRERGLFSLFHLRVTNVTKQQEWERKLEDLAREHAELTEEKARLISEIRKMEGREK